MTGEKLLWVWGEQMRVRGEDPKFRAVYVGNIDWGTYKPVDDPHPHAFVICIVETALVRLGPEYWDYAWSLYVDPKSVADLGSWRKRTDMRREIVGAVTASVGRGWYESINDIDADEIIRELRAMRGAKGAEHGVKGGRPRKNPSPAIS